MTVLLFFAFLSGVVTIFAPCIWPILPVVLSAGAIGGERRPLGIVLGLSTSFLLIMLTLASLVKVIPFDPETLRSFAVAVIAFFGLVLVLPMLGAKLESLGSRLSGIGGRFTRHEGTGFGSGFLTGLALGVVWSPCAGPILATVATLAATQAVNARVFLITLSFVAGVSVPLFFLAILGRTMLMKTRVLSRYGKVVQQVFGAIMILAALAIYTGADKSLQARILDMFPNYGNILNQLEKNDTVKEQLDALKASPKEESKSPKKDMVKQKLDELKGVHPETTLLKKEVLQKGMKSDLPQYGQAPEFSGIGKWLNTDTALTVKDLRGKVVLVDFWTYSCINCIRTLPYVTAWYEKYKDQGFVVVGVHTPEFEFEKKTANVADALVKYHIKYPVAQDNDSGTWQAYGNQYWPAQYLVDADGNVRRYHFGEGEYTETERAIQALLQESNG